MLGAVFRVAGSVFLVVAVALLWWIIWIGTSVPPLSDEWYLRRGFLVGGFFFALAGGICLWAGFFEER